MRSQYRFAGPFSTSGVYDNVRKVMNSFSPGILLQPSSLPRRVFHFDFSSSGREKKAWLAAKRAEETCCKGCGPGALSRAVGSEGVPGVVSSIALVGVAGCGNVTTVHPKLPSVPWFSEITSGSGDFLNGGLVLFTRAALRLRLERKRDMRFEMEKWSDLEVEVEVEVEETAAMVRCG